MLLFNKKDMLVICKYDGNEVTFSKSLKEILKYQYKYNYKFKLYATGGEFVGTFIADDYCIDGENLTIFIGDYIVEYNSSGTSIETVTGGSGGEGGEGKEKIYLKVDFEFDPVAEYYNAVVVQWDLENKTEITRDEETLYNLIYNSADNVYLVSPHNIVISHVINYTDEYGYTRLVFNAPAYLYGLSNYNELTVINADYSVYSDFYAEIEMQSYEDTYHVIPHKAQAISDNGITPLSVFHLYID